eukprot:m.68822 g.68822  ORF g.68822 m.68822 type:complete len:274 (+) comp13930_c2_seq1:120-941(+)
MADAADEFDALVVEFREQLTEHTVELDELVAGATNNPGSNPDDHTIKRYLRARKKDVKGAVEQYIATVKWRSETVPENILDPDTNEPVYAAICPHVNHGFDKQGRPIYIEKTGEIRVPKLLKYLTPEQLVQRHVRQQEIALKRMQESSERLGQPVEKQLIILDLKHMSFAPNGTGLSVFKETVRIDQNYYPEMLGDLFIINAPWVFHPVWAVLKPWLDPVTRAKFHVLGSGFKEQLLELVDPDQLPVDLGGTCECEGGCVKPLVPLPEDYPQL